MADTTSTPSINFMALMNPEFAAKQQALTRQQLIAQQMMQDGSQLSPTELANPGGLAVPQSPLMGASKAAQKMLGAYMQKDLDAKQLDAYKLLGQSMAGTANAGAGGASTQSLAQSMMADPSFQMATALHPETGAKALVDHLMKTSEQKNFADPGMHDLVQGEMQSKGLVNVNGHFMPANSLYPKAATPASPAAAPQGNMPPAPAMANGKPQAPANMDALLNQQSQNNVMPNPIPGTTPGVDFNDPIAVKEAENYGEKTSGFYADLSNKLQQSSIDSNSKINDYKQIDNLLEGINTGKFQGNINDIKKVAGRIGFELPKDVGPVEAANALSTRLSLEARNEGGNNLLPGSMSNYEDKLLQNMKPGIENSTSGRKIMVDFAVRKLQRDQQLADLAGQYEDKHGKLDRNFTKEVKSFVAANPLYAEGEFEAKIAEAEKAQQLVEGSTPKAAAGRIPVIAPDGKAGTIDAAHLDEFLQAGGRKR